MQVTPTPFLTPNALVPIAPATLSQNTLPSFRGKCTYKTGRCMNERTTTTRGGIHTFCEWHRRRHNATQRRSDTKWRQWRRRTVEKTIHSKNCRPRKAMKTDDGAETYQSPVDDELDADEIDLLLEMLRDTM
ncbi:Aste57867_8164 [Aphanomyces stellatus]|uniref:Aste57867_8164 protein n=1 Tax=Aphanomyces stellatus TaxID=120398 RepID=A0A485KJI4_9STRA|nr:hypothetical protein As57867_008134 [Aphanomyces stellatus]VFT85052.1 Aste57867_8164 [Aphanomyces stellatus]